MNREIKFRGKMIPENEWIFGTILRIPAPPVCFGKSEPDKVRYWGAEWDIEIIDKKDYEKYHNYGWGLFFECEVIGNIFDNPELLGGE